MVTAVVAGSCCVGGSDMAYAMSVGRHYEMVSPVFKGGFGATMIDGVSPGGEGVAFYSAGIFDGASAGGAVSVGNGPTPAKYLAHRGATGWSTTPLMALTSLSDNGFEEVSPDLSLAVTVGSPTIHSYELTEEIDTWVRPTSLPDTLTSWQGVPIVRIPGKELGLQTVTASADLCHLFAATSGGLAHKAEPIAEAEGTDAEVYEIDRGCDGKSSSIKLVGVNNQNRLIAPPKCRVNVGNTESGSLISPALSTSYNAVSTDASVVYFTACPGAEPPQHQLFARLGGSRTVEVSRPLEAGQFGGCVSESNEVPGEVPCKGAATRPSADFRGAAEDGSKVYFTASLASSGSPLVSGDGDVSTNLYMATIGCPAAKPGCAPSEREVTSLAEASHDPNSAAADVQGILRIAPNGQRAYFVAGGDLLSAAQQIALEGEGRLVPQTGAENLYEYDSSSGTVRFIIDLCTGREQSGAAEDFRCPSGESDMAVWGSGGPAAGESQTGGAGGEFLVFSSYGQLTSDDTNAAKDIYRYDAVTGELTLVSHGENGYDPNGSSGLLGSKIAQGHHGDNLLENHEANTRAISDGGSRIVFTSAEPLSEGDTNGLVNAYEWHDGSVSLVSTGSDTEPVGDVVISPDGSSVVFDTVQGLVAQDTDGLPDVYVARLGAGFPRPPAERAPCAGDGCQGPLTNPSALLVPTSATAVPEAIVPTPGAVKRKPKIKRPRSCKRTRLLHKRPGCERVNGKARRSMFERRPSHGPIRGGRS
jgi:hypothetical protein